MSLGNLDFMCLYARASGWFCGGVSVYCVVKYIALIVFVLFTPLLVYYYVCVDKYRNSSCIFIIWPFQSGRLCP
jgi:hypothetical protein